MKLEEQERAHLQALATATQASTSDREHAGQVVPQTGDLKAVPVFDPKLNFWYTGSPPVLEEANIDGTPIVAKEEGTEKSGNLIFDPKLNFWYTKKQSEDELLAIEATAEAAAELTRQKMEKEGRAILEAEKEKAKALEEAASNAAASVYDQMKLKSIEDSKAEGAARMKAQKEEKEAQTMQELIKKKEEIEAKLGKPKSSKPGDSTVKKVTIAAAEEGVMGQRQLAHKRKDTPAVKQTAFVLPQDHDVGTMEEEDESEEKDDKKGEIIEAKKVETKPTGIALPMSEAAEDWMDDDFVGTMDEDDEEEEKKEGVKTSIKEPVKTETVPEKVQTKPTGIALPMSEAADDWMDDDFVGTMDEDDEEEEKKEGIKTSVKEPVKTETVPEKVETKPTGIALPMSEAADDWMDDDFVGTMDEDDEEEEKKEGIKTSVKEPVKTETVPEKVETKPTGIALPMSEAAEDWMDDDFVGTMDEDDEEEEKKETVKTNIKESVKTETLPGKVETKPTGIALPMKEAAEDWMDDDFFGTMDEEDEEEENKEDIKPSTKVPLNTETVPEKVETKPTGIALPMNEAAEDWMDADCVGTMDEDDKEEEEKKEGVQIHNKESAKIEKGPEKVEAKPTGIALPMTEAAEDWMDDDFVGTMDDDDEEEENKVEVKTTETAPEKKVDIKPAGIALPMNEAADDWMNDEVVGTMDDDDEETPLEKPDIKVQQKEIEVAIEAKESPKTEDVQNKSATETPKATEKQSKKGKSKKK